MAALSEEERRRLALMEDRRRVANDRARRRSLGGSRVARRALEERWAPLRDFLRERGQE